MKRLLLGFAGAAMTVNSGCTAVVKEVRYPGGLAGSTLDRRTFDASGSKQLILFRANLILAMAADMGQVTVNAQDADAFAKLLASAAEEINYAAADVYGGGGSADGPCRASAKAVSQKSDDAKTGGAKVGEAKIKNGKEGAVAPANEQSDDAGCVGFVENFESNIPRIEGRIIKVMLAALPTDKARKFLDDVSSGNVFGAALSAIGAVAKSIGGLHYAFGRYRTGLETVAASRVGCQPGSTVTEYDPANGTVWDAARCMGLSEDKLFENPGEAGRENLRTARVSQRVFFMLMRSIAADCVSLPYSGKGDDLATSQQSRMKACNSIGFEPTARPYRIDQNNKPAATISVATKPVDGGVTSVTPTPAPTQTPAPASAASPAPALQAPAVQPSPSPIHGGT